MLKIDSKLTVTNGSKFKGITSGRLQLSNKELFPLIKRKLRVISFILNGNEDIILFKYDEMEKEIVIRWR